MKIEFNFGRDLKNKPFLFDIYEYKEKNESVLKESLLLMRDFNEINNSVLSYFLIHGYQDSFKEFSEMIKNEENYKHAMNLET